MEISQIRENRRDYMDLLLLASPRMDVLERELDDGDMFVLSENGDVLTVCIAAVKHKSCELKYIATAEGYQGRGYGKYMVNYICEHYSFSCDIMYAGTGNTWKGLEFYKKCGFTNSHIDADTDMIYLKRHLDTQIDVKRVVDLAVEAGRILLKNGGEIFRVEETIRHICRRFHVDDVEPFILSHGIFISAENGTGEHYTRIRHVPLSGSHLGIVAEVNDLSREISAGHVGIEEAFLRLSEIDKMPPKPGYFRVLAAGIGSSCFAMLLNSTIAESAVVFVIGCVLYSWVLLAKKLNLSKIIVNIMGGVIMTVLSVLAMHIWSQGALRLEGMITGAIMPLIPGVAFVNAIREIADSDFLSGTVRMIDALLVFVYIAIGVGSALAFYNRIAGGLLL